MQADGCILKKWQAGAFNWLSSKRKHVNGPCIWFDRIQWVVKIAAEIIFIDSKTE
jgi:hypothetical protein